MRHSTLFDLDSSTVYPVVLGGRHSGNGSDKRDTSCSNSDPTSPGSLKCADGITSRSFSREY